VIDKSGTGPTIRRSTFRPVNAAPLGARETTSISEDGAEPASDQDAGLFPADHGLARGDADGSLRGRTIREIASQGLAMTSFFCGFLTESIGGPGNTVPWRVQGRALTLPYGACWKRAKWSHSATENVLARRWGSMPARAGRRRGWSAFADHDGGG